ncbi:hypothetical protein Tco_1004649 [Tanacetum coccineum]|uniref:Uncharacterized protein n=1 Tax=Tanacetum coccineum TaxID=301880 RepID=A0ABQ5FCG7_9ASTR
MAQQQHAADVHPDEVCPPNKRYDLMDANKKIDFEHVQCPPESKILTNIIKNHPLRFSIIASSSVPRIYMAQFWHTLNEDGSKYRLTFMLDKKELSLTLDDFRTIFHLPQATDNNHDSFVPPPSFLDMVPFYKNELGFRIELKTSLSFKTTGLLQPWKTLRVRDRYHNLKDDDIMKNIFNSGRHKDKIGMKIPDWMISEEMKHTEHYWMHAEVFGIEVPLTQSQPTESTQGTHRTPSAPRRSTCLTPLAPVPTIDKADEMILQDTLQVRARSDKESPEVEITNNEEVEITNVVILMNVNEEEEEITDEVYELKRREKGKIDVMVESLPTMVDKHIKEQVKKQQNKEETDKMIAKAMLQERGKLQAEISLQIQQAIDINIPSLVDASVPQTTCRSSAIRLRDQDDPHDDAHLEGENSAKQQKTSEYEAHVTGESSGQVNEKEQDDDEILTKQVSQDIMEEVSLAINEAELKKIANEMLRQRCTSGDEHQYHID